jgi:hypothetical protein
MTAIEPILTKITLAQRFFLNNTFTEFHENPTNSFIADNTSQTAGRGIRIRLPIFN